MKNDRINIFHTSPLIIPAVCLMAGIVLGHELHLSMVWLWLLVAVVGVACLLWKWRHLQTITIMVGVVLFGALLRDAVGHHPSPKRVVGHVAHHVDGMDGVVEIAFHGHRSELFFVFALPSSVRPSFSRI